MKRFYFFCSLMLLVLPALAQGVCLRTKSTEIQIDQEGCFSSVQVEKKEILGAGKYPLLTIGMDNQLLVPVKMESNDSILQLRMSDGGEVVLQYRQSDVCVTLEVKDIPQRYDILIYGPLGVNIHEVVGDVIGVAQGKGVAFGIQALNIKTNAGIPEEYGALVTRHYRYVGKESQLSVANIASYRLAATDTGDGTVFQFSARKRDRDEYRSVLQLKKSLALSVEGEDGAIKGSKIAMFGCKQKDALARIGEIELEQHLPHPLFDGEWGKTSRAAMKSYLISDFSENNLDMVLDKAEIAGFKYIYHSGPFSDWGHFNWNSSFTRNGDEGVKCMVDKAKAKGINMGVHTLSNFITTNDSYVTPVPSRHLQKQGVLTLTDDITESQTDIRIQKNDLFEIPLSLNTLQIDDELIIYNKVEKETDFFLLKDCKRGAFKTKASGHSSKTPLYKLSDHAYKVFFPDLALQDTLADRIADLMNKTGLSQISFDGLEGCSYTGHDEYATSRFVTRCYTQFDHNVINDASRLNHNLWHIHTRMNWGEPWGEAMRTGQVANRIKNQDFFQRNLFPRMLGWFLIRLADRKFECSTLEDVEWALSEAAGFDAGYAMTMNTTTLNRHGQIDRLLQAIKHWDILREAQAFTEEQKQRLKDPQSEWHLQKVDEKNYQLYPLFVSKRYYCNLAELQPGQPGGADWIWENKYSGPCKIQVKLEGEGTVSNLSFTTSAGTVRFPCKLEGGQYLLYDFDGNATVTDKNYNVIEVVDVEGALYLSETSSPVSFSCEPEVGEAPEVVVRYITHGNPEKVSL